MPCPVHLASWGLTLCRITPAGRQYAVATRVIVAYVPAPLATKRYPASGALRAAEEVVCGHAPGPPRSGYGLVTYVQAVPFQCRIRVWYPVPVEALAVKPTAHALDDDVAATALRMLC